MVLVIHYELLKASFSEALPVINYSLNLIVSAICKKNGNVQGLVACIKKILFNESQNVPILHHICLFVIKYNTVSYIMIISIIFIKLNCLYLYVILVVFPFQRVFD